MATALEAIHKHCLMCVNGYRDILRTCEYKACPLWPYRMGTRPADGIPHRPLKACRRFCVDECQAEQAHQVQGCQGNTWAVGPCPLYKFRMGKSPNISQETKEKRRANAKGRPLPKGFAKQAPSSPAF